MRRLGPLAVLVVAVVARAAVIWHSRGGYLGDVGYDSSVYYAAADALIHGRLPYADFILLHPPALPLVLTPFAWLGTVTTDHTGFVVATCAFELLGGVNSALTLVVARRAGCGRGPALLAGLFYALWPGSIGAEISDRLEPLGNFFLLCALLVLVTAMRDGWTTRRYVVCGGLLGAAVVTKIWWLVPLLVIVVWLAWRDRRGALRVTAGAALVAVIVLAPFAIRAPAAMWRMVVTDQLGRARTGGSPPSRLAEIASLGWTSLPGTTIFTGVALVLIAVLAVYSSRRAWRLTPLRPAVLLVWAQLLVLLAAPTYFRYYADFLTPALALVVACAFAAPAVARQTVRRWAAAAVLAVLAVSAAFDLDLHSPGAVLPFPGRVLSDAAAAAHVRCVMSDSPMALVELDVLSSGLADGCPNRVDVSGSTYDIDRASGAHRERRKHNKRWQHAIYHYLLSGDAELTIRSATGINRATHRRLARLPVIVAAHGIVLRRTPHHL